MTAPDEKLVASSAARKGILTQENHLQQHCQQLYGENQQTKGHKPRSVTVCDEDKGCSGGKYGYVAQAVQG